MPERVPPDANDPSGRGAAASLSSAEAARFQGAFAVVILPTLNEERGLDRTLSELPLDQFDETGQRVVPLVIDGGSTDGTLEVARRWGVPVLRQTTRGKGGAVLEAIAWVHERGVPYVVVLDADATYPPDRILPTLDLLRGGADLVIGVRRPVWGPPSDVKDLVHRVGNLLMSYTSSLLSQRTILDLCSGFWGTSTRRFMDLGLGDQNFAIEAELVLRSIRAGLNVRQIPIHYRERLGEAKLHAVRDGGQIFLTIFQNARRGPEAQPARAGSSPWGRDLLSIGLVLGISGAVVECAPPQAVEAANLARFLRRNLPDTRVQVGPVSSKPVTGSVAEVSPNDTPLVVSLPPADPPSGEPRSATVSIKNARRQLTIQLPASAPEPTSEEVSAWSRAGGWSEPEQAPRERFPSLHVVTSRLNFERERQQETLLRANGFRMVRQGPERTPAALSKPLDLVPPTPTDAR